MSKDKNYSINNLLNDNSFINWVVSNTKNQDEPWNKIKSDLKGKNKTDFDSAIQIIRKIKMLNIDNQKDLKSPEFIQNQYSRLLEASNNDKTKKVKVFKLSRIQKYAAAIIILISVSASIILSTGTKNTFYNHLAQVDFNNSDLLIQTPDKAYFKIDTNANKKWVTKNGVFISIDAEGINFSETDELKPNTTNTYKVIVPKGKVYNVNLIDGTNAELNANTSIAFNTATISKYRTIDLKGEAFFDVTHNKARPFIVQSSDMKIEVLGTEFNVSNYVTNDYTSTTLIDGSIKVSNPQGENKIITPGDQAKLFRNQNQIIVNKINTQNVVSWASSIMIFDNEKLENLIPKLNEWYNTEFVIVGDALKEFTFTGTLRKKHELTYFLEILKYTENINYEISEGQVKLFSAK